MNLFEINAEYMAAEEELFASVNEDGELDPEALAKYEALKEDRENFIERCILSDKNDKAMVEALDNEIKSLQERKKVLQNKVSWRENYLSGILYGEKFETARAKATFRKSEKVIVSIEPSDLPEEFRKVKTEISADKTALKTAIKAGQKIDGVFIETNYNIQIK